MFQILYSMAIGGTLLLLPFIASHNFVITHLIVPTPSGSYIKVNITLSDILTILIYHNNNSSKNISFSNKKDVQEFVNKINEEIKEHRKIYNFYYNKFKAVYPEKYFIICIENSCSYAYLNETGIELTNASIRKPFIIILSAKAADEIVESMENKDKEIIEKVKELLIHKEIELKNFDIIAKRIIENYEKR